MVQRITGGIFCPEEEEAAVADDRAKDLTPTNQ